MAHNITGIPGAVKFKDIRSKLAKHSSAKYSTRALNKITHIAVHHAASSKTATPYDFASQHVKKGWPGIGYHLVIEQDGTVNWCQNLETISYNVGDNNSYIVGVNMVGNFDNYAPTQAQMTSLYAVLRYLMSLLNVPASKVLGHKEFPGQSTACPGKNVSMDAIRQELGGSGGSSGGGYGVPPSSSYSGPNSTNFQSDIKGKLAGTDQWNGLIDQVSSETGVNALLIKVIMSIETGGRLQTDGKPNTAGYYGLMQTNYNNCISKYGAKFKNDPYTQIKAGADELKGKKDYWYGVKSRGNARGTASEQSWEIFQTAWLYNGYSNEGYRYAVHFKTVYEGMGGKMSDPVIGNASSPGRGGGSGGGFGIGGGVDGYELNDPNSTMFRGKSPDVEDDDYPTHRRAGNPYALRIGDSQFFLAPDHIKTTKVTMVDSRHVVRSKNPLMTKSGYTTHKVEIRLFFCGQDQINGWKVGGPGGLTYYMDGLRSMIAQFYKNPFLPIRNELINDRHGIFNIALHNISYSTVPDFPNILVADLTFIECTVEPLVNLPDYMYDRLFMYPLFRWWYQHQLSDKESDRFSGTYLKPVPKDMHGKVFFKALDRDLVEQMKDDVVSKNKGGQVAGEYALSKYHVGDIQKLMTDWPLGDVICTNVTVGINKQLTPFHIDDYEKPVFQDIGGVDKEFSLEFYCTDRNQLESLQALVSHLEEMARDYRFRFVSGFLAVDNELVNLAGIYHAMVLGIDTQTVPGYENNYIVRLYCKAFDPTQKNQERLSGFNFEMTEAPKLFDEVQELDTKLNRKNGVAYEYMMNKVFNSLELYPDLELPTFASVNKWITKINDHRTKKGQSKLPFDKLNQPTNAIWVDPDFYFAYPTMEQAYSAVEIGDMGDKIVNVLMNGSYDELDNMAEGELGLKAAYDEIVLGVRDNTFDPDLNWKRKITRDSSISWDNAVRTYTVPAGQKWDEKNPIPSDTQLVNMMCRDMVRHNKRHRMARAFPSYMLLFIDEGQWVDGRRMFNNFYAYHSIHQIDVVKDKDNAVDLAYIRLSNTYGTFDWEPSMTDPREGAIEPKGLMNRIKALWKDFNFTVTDKLMKESQELMEHAKLVEGARVHIRLGYSATADDMPIVFNGRIASVGEGEEIDIVCQGDGAELINSFVSTDPKGHTPNEPHNAIQEILTSRTSNYWFNVSADYEFGDNYLSEFGIESFGFVESTAQSGFWKGLLTDHLKIAVSGLNDSVPFSAYDIMKNIYKGSQSPVTGQNTGWNPFDGEKNINIGSYQKTPWDIGTILSQFVPEFIFAPHPHGFRSTLFFGMPHWPVKYGYVLKDGKEGTSYDHYDELVKPYQQFHVITTGNDIIKNDIKASSEHIKHIAVGIYKMGDGQKAAQAWTVYADRSIARDRQKMMIVDTGVWQDLFGPDFLYTALGKYVLKPIAELPATIASLLAEFIGWIPDFIEPKKAREAIENWAEDFTNMWDEDAVFTPGQVQARTVSIGSLQRNFMEMYQGELVIFGDPAMKPWDIFYLNDTHLMISGTAQVGKVSHSLSRATGFTSVIKPDLLVSRTDGMGKRTAIINGLIALGSATSVYLARKLVTSRLAVWIVQRSGSATVKVGKGAAKVGGKFTPKSIKNSRVAKWGKDLSGLGKDALKNAKFGSKALKLLKSNMFTFVISGALSEWLQTWYEKETKYNNMIYIYPLWKMGRPFAAGITGAAHIIPGYIDPRYMDPRSTGVGASGGGSSDVADGGLGSSGEIRHPLPRRTSINSDYGWRDLDGNGTEEDFHNGTDLAPTGKDARGVAIDTPIYAIADGTITSAGYHSSMGNYVYHKIHVGGKPHIVVYMHMQNKGFLPNGLKSGSPVKKGQQLGIMGTTGHSTGVHLHIEVAAGETRVIGDGQGGKGDNRVDPEVWFKKHGVTL